MRPSFFFRAPGSPLDTGSGRHF
ncbi:hypothetical protein CGLO_05602 [Colletotrichum gloeosporioides Cg-14]|uniref:Uncharacterized protein n=1 Tax=Colletotrichum gloeosporioides (strain Cg-14) TaxID=1237896 RepID=T0KPU2_COLGC|nr:hypothetical protein CGLO_05602 [Colletotrichum gloeosporioides Cg-14]